MEQNKLLNKTFKQTFRITNIKHIIIGKPFITKYIPDINILDSKVNIKDKTQECITPLSHSFKE